MRVRLALVILMLLLAAAALGDEQNIFDASLRRGVSNAFERVATQPPTPDPFVDALNWELQQFWKKYSFFHSSAEGAEGNCFATLTSARNYLQQKYPDYDVTLAHTPFNDGRGTGLMSITHPSLILRNRKTGQVMIATTNIFDEQDAEGNVVWKNYIAVESLGTNPEEKTVVARLMRINNSPVVKLDDRVYADPVAWALWDEPNTRGPCLRYSGTHTSLSSPFADGAQIVLANDGKVYLARRFQQNMRVAGIDGQVKMLGILPPMNGGASLASQALIGGVGGHAAGEAINIVSMLISGNTITELKASREVRPGLEVGVKSNFTLNPNDPMQGFTEPNVFMSYASGDEDRSVRYYLDRQLNAAAQFRRDDRRLTLGYDGRNRDFLWNVGMTGRYGRLTLDASAGRGASIGNLNLPSELARPTLGVGGDQLRNYVKVSGSIALGGGGRTRGRGPAAAAPAPAPADPTQFSPPRIPTRLGPQRNAAADTSDSCESRPSPSFSRPKRLNGEMLRVENQEHEGGGLGDAVLGD